MRTPIAWAGGKSRLAAKLVSMLPQDFSRKTTVVEPFAGAASLSFRAGPESAYLADSNPHLINFWRWVRDDVGLLILEIHLLLEQERFEGSRAVYLRCRDRINEIEGPRLCSDAALLAYCNVNAYARMWRTNKLGKMNTPFGGDDGRALALLPRLNRAHQVIQGWQFECGAFADLGLPADLPPDSVLYLDPPYVESAHTSYSGAGFTREDRRAMVALARESGLRFMVSDLNTPEALEDYKGLRTEVALVGRTIAQKTRSKAEEIVAVSW